jgi:hypothetical protein
MGYDQEEDVSPVVSNRESVHWVGGIEVDVAQSTSCRQEIGHGSARNKSPSERHVDPGFDFNFNFNFISITLPPRPFLLNMPLLLSPPDSSRSEQ